MNNQTTKDYIPYGEEWEKEMSKFPKPSLIKMLGYQLKKAASTPSSEQGSDGWIDSEKLKPPYNKGVMVFIPEEDYHQTSGMWDIDNKWVLLDEYRVPENPVTHWRELYDIPEPYKTERQDLYKVVQFPTPPQSKE